MYGDPSGNDIEMIVGNPYVDSLGKKHPYGHMAIRVKNEAVDVVYDFGRYRKTWGLFDSEGEGILNIRDGKKYINSEQQIRDSKGFTFKTTMAQDEKAMKYFEKQINNKEAKFLFNIDQKTGKRYKLKENYHYKKKNCVTESINGLESAEINFFDKGTYKPLDALEQLEKGTLLNKTSIEYMNFYKKLGK